MSDIPFNKGGSETQTQGHKYYSLKNKIGRLFSAAGDKRLKRHKVLSPERKSNLDNGLKTINCSAKKKEREIFNHLWNCRAEIPQI